MGLGGYNEKFRYVQDYELWSRIIYSNSVLNLKEVIGEKRILSNAISFRDDILVLRNVLLMKAKFKHFVNGNYGVISFLQVLKPFIWIIKSFLNRAFVNWKIKN